MQPLALVMQCFVKADTLQSACESLLRCTGVEALDIVFWSDSPLGSRSEGRYAPLAAAVEAFLDGFVEEYSNRFRSVARYRNERNMGTCKTCQIALDFAFSAHSFVIFVEDDVVFARDALEWFDEIRLRRLLQDRAIWAVAGESIFFNARSQEVPAGWPEAMRDYAAKERLNAAYVTERFIPSTCFATTRERWVEFGATRGQPLGDVDLCKRCEVENRYGIFPIVPRVKDVGMLHDEGFSVLVHTKVGVTEIKNTYVMSDDVEGPGVREMSHRVSNLGEIFTLTTLLKRP